MARGLDGLSLQAASRSQSRRADAERGSAARDAGTPFANVMEAEERGAARPASSETKEAASPEESKSRAQADAESKPAGSTTARGAVKSADRGSRACDAEHPASREEPGEDDGGATLDDSAVSTVLGLCGAPAEPATTGDAPAAGTSTGAPTLESAVAVMNLAVVASPPMPPAAEADPGMAKAAAGPAAELPALGGVGAGAADARASTLATLQASALLDRADSGSNPEAGAAASAPDGVNPAAVVDARVAGRPVAERASSQPPPEIRSPLGTPAWSDELGSRVTWMVERGEQVASLKLTPEHLGPLEVRIAVREGETSVWFGATQADTRAALEQSLPRLREMLGASGLSLANAGVFSHTPRDPQRGFTAAALARAAQESGSDPQSGVVTTVTRRGLVDLYA